MATSPRQQHEQDSACPLVHTSDRRPHGLPHTVRAFELFDGDLVYFADPVVVAAALGELATGNGTVTAGCLHVIDRSDCNAAAAAANRRVVGAAISPHAEQHVIYCVERDGRHGAWRYACYDRAERTRTVFREVGGGDRNRYWNVRNPRLSILFRRQAPHVHVACHDAHLLELLRRFLVSQQVL